MKSTDVTTIAKALKIQYVRVYFTDAIKYDRVKLYCVRDAGFAAVRLQKRLSRIFKNLEVRILTSYAGRMSIEFKVPKDPK